MIGELSVNATTQPLPWYQNVLQTAAQVATQYLTFEQQRDLLRIQNQRASQGLPPLDVSQYTPGVSFGVESSTRNTGLIIAGIIGGAILLSSLSRRGR